MLNIPILLPYLTMFLSVLWGSSEGSESAVKYYLGKTRKVSSMNSEVKEKIRKFIVENFLFGNDDGLKDDSSFLDEGIIDSTGILELVSFLEEEFLISVEDEELIPENLDSIANVTAYLEKKV